METAPPPTAKKSAHFFVQLGRIEMTRWIDGKGRMAEIAKQQGARLAQGLRVSGCGEIVVRRSPTGQAREWISQRMGEIEGE
jgi:hypothetical protein